jgi:TonB-linked SusC/RagA family outer membrane protein
LIQRQETVRGTVTDSRDGEVLPGVNIFVKGTTTGTTTGDQGNYELTVPTLKDTLVFSFVGYQTKEVAINGRTELDVVLRPQTLRGEEVVVVGYGTQERQDLTGAVSSIPTQNLDSRPVPSIEASLQGRASGVRVRQAGGKLDGDFEINIRGVGTVTGDDSPLFVVDGVPLFSGGLSTINENNIESIEVLKDASASAIYGARASGGVVVITTKSGRTEDTELSFSSSIGFENITKKLDMMTTEEQRQLFVDAFKNSGVSTAVFDDPDLPVWNTDNNWQDLMTRTAMRHEYDINLNGGNENTTFSINGGYKNREGVMIQTNLTRYILSTNVNHNFGEDLLIDARVSGSHQKQNVMDNSSGSYFGGSGSLTNALASHSYTPHKDEEGSFTGPPTTGPPYFGNNTNVVAQAVEEDRRQSRTRIFGNTRLQYDIINSLTATLSAGGDVLSTSTFEFLPPFERGANRRLEGNVTEVKNSEINGVVNATLRYSDEFAGTHSVDGLVGGEVQQFFNKTIVVNGQGTSSRLLDQLANQSSFNAGGSEVTTGISSQFMRLNYSYDDRYSLTGTLRRDGSSQFGPENRWGYFPSGAVAWRITNEDFFDISAINQLKLRVSFGETGNQSIGNFEFLSRAGQANYAFGDERVLGNARQNLGNPRLKWESVEELNVGVNLSLFESRIIFGGNIYNRRSKNLLIETPIPLTAGVEENPTVNLGSVRNRGIELSLTSRNFTAPFSWETNINFSYNQNEVLDIGTNAIGEPLQIPGNIVPLPNDLVNLTVAGRPVGALRAWEFDGLWRRGEEEEAAKYGAVPGDAKIADNNNNNRLDPDDRVWAGNPQPKAFGGITNTLQYENLTLSATLNYAIGHELFRGTKNLVGRAVPFVQNLSSVNDYWTPDNPDASVPRPAQGGDASRTQFLSTLASTRFIEDADYLRLNNLTVSYTLPDRFINGLRLGDMNATLTFSGRNLLTITPYGGFDPAANTFDSPISAGQDMTPAPISRTYTFMLDLTF